MSVKKPKLILHMGTHKTGTSSLQRFLFKNHVKLRLQGLRYPHTPASLGKPGQRQAHHQIAHGIALSDVQPERFAQIIGYLNEVAESSLPEETILMSSEVFWRRVSDCKCASDIWPLRQKYVKDLAAALQAFEVEVHVFFRRQDDLLVSLYRGKCMRGRFRNSDAQDWRPKSQIVLAYFDNLELCSAAFGREHVHAHLYDGSMHGMPGIGAMLEKMGVGQLEINGLDYEQQHASPKSGAAAEFFRHVVKHQDSDADVATLRRYFQDTLQRNDRTGALLDLFEEQYVEFGELADSNEQNQKLMHEYFEDEFEHLFGSPIRTRLPIYVPKDVARIVQEVEDMRLAAGVVHDSGLL